MRPFDAVDRKAIIGKGLARCHCIAVLQSPHPSHSSQEQEQEQEQEQGFPPQKWNLTI